MVTDTTINIVISVPNFEASSFKARRFELCFEDKQAGESDLIYGLTETRKYVVRMAGLDFLLME